MKKTILLSSILALLLTGCYQKGPEINTQQEDLHKSLGLEKRPTYDLTEKKEELKIEKIEEKKIEQPEEIGAISEAKSSDSKIEVPSIDLGLKTIYFDYDKFDLREDMYQDLMKNVAILKNRNIKLEGNCDEFGSDEYNYALGLKRANTVKSYLINSGYDENKISMTSFGESNPSCLESNEECFSKNRRVEFKLQ